MIDNTHQVQEQAPDPGGGNGLLTRTEVARRLRIHPSTVDSWREKYGLPAIEKGNKVYFDWADVTAWLKCKPQKARRRKRARNDSTRRKGKTGGGRRMTGKELEQGKREDAARERSADH